MAGNGTYTPRAPVHRIDANGFLMQRELSKEEKAESMKRTLKAAGLGAVAGVGVALGGSKLLRHLQDASEVEQMAYAQKNSLPKRILQDEMEAHQEQIGLIDRDLSGIDSFTYGDRARELIGLKGKSAKSVAAAKELLAAEEKRIIGLAESAKEFRRSRPFGHVPDVVDPRYLSGHPSWRKGKDPKGSLLGSLKHEGIDLDNTTLDPLERSQKASTLREYYKQMIRGR